MITVSRRVAGAALLSLLGGLAAGLPARPALGAEGCVESVPFASNTGGYRGFRIPAVVGVGEEAGGDAARGVPGVLVAFAEGRVRSLADDGDIDVVARRSLDGGCTWGPLRVVADAGRDTVGNPSPVVDPATGRIVLLSCRNVHGVMGHRRVFVQHSDDAGVTFSPPREITGQVKPEHWNWYGTGPGHALALRYGPHAGRLLVPANHSYRTAASVHRSGAHSLHSDDGGETWRLGYVAQPEDASLRLEENALAELPGGLIYTNVRNQSDTASATRADAYLEPGGTALLTAYRPQPALTGPVVHGSVLWVEPRPPGSPALLFSGPADPGSRKAMTLRVSHDRGRTWREGPRLTAGPAAYSDLVPLGPDTVGVLYERGAASPYETLTFTRVPIAPLTRR
ncbi:exo-alpha-sialidase [Streptomyces sp. DH37]|uniref:sialidase family protein n=1 Tax=Streptomyces sp. DH37 TaxID=3040122 RepID=UPI0024430341|nr:sialidase family protein [Streptomyces sp. DH37]MDG9705668.1 sialidase family protein [Streptomyces sp. DH37]